MPLDVREICKFCQKEIIPEKMGRIACRLCFPSVDDAVDFKNQEERNAYYREKDAQLRGQKLPKNRICVRCDELKLDTRSWVVREDRLVVCRSCNYELNLMKGRRMDLAFEKAFIAEYYTRFTVDGRALREARKSIRISMRGLAKECKWGVTYQNDLECGDITSISEAAYNKVIAAFEKLKEIPDYDEEIKDLKVKQRRGKMDYHKEYEVIREKQKIAKKEFGKTMDND